MRPTDKHVLGLPENTCNSATDLIVYDDQKAWQRSCEDQRSEGSIETGNR